MSVDEFDPLIERMFSRPPALPDADLFAAGVENRLAASSRWRRLALVGAGLVGGVIAVAQGLKVSIGGAKVEESQAATSLVQSADAVILHSEHIVQSLADHLGLSGLAVGSSGGMQMFWVAAALMIGAVATVMTRLSREI